MEGIYIYVYMNSQYSEIWELPGIQVNHDDPCTYMLTTIFFGVNLLNIRVKSRMCRHESIRSAMFWPCQFLEKSKKVSGPRSKLCGNRYLRRACFIAPGLQGVGRWEMQATSDAIFFLSVPKFDGTIMTLTLLKNLNQSAGVLIPRMTRFQEWLVPRLQLSFACNGLEQFCMRSPKSSQEHWVCGRYTMIYQCLLLSGDCKPTNITGHRGCSNGSHKPLLGGQLVILHLYHLYLPGFPLKRIWGAGSNPDETMSRWSTWCWDLKQKHGVTLWLTNSYGKSPCLMGKSTIKPFSTYQRVVFWIGMADPL